MNTAVVSYLLDVDDVVVVLGEVRTDGLGVGGLVTRDVVGLDDLGEASDVHGEDAEVAARLGEGEGAGGQDASGDEHLDGGLHGDRLFLSSSQCVRLK